MQFHFCEEVTDGKSALQVSWTGGGRQKKQQLSSWSPQTNKSLRHMPVPQKDATQQPDENSTLKAHLHL